MELRKEALRAGMVEFLEKPIQAAVIAAKIQEFISSER
jgi:FixJ family two-component response regulator